MEHNRLIYLDNAATSFPKPPEVYAEVVRTMMQYGGNPGRGTHRLSLAAADRIYECRERAAKLFGLEEPERVFFTLNTTYGLNTVIKGVLREGDHVLISDLEHNAVYRPIYKLAKEGKISYSIYSSMAYEKEGRDEKICSDILRKLRKNTKMLICTHASNICSLTMPIEKIARLCKSCGIFMLVDGAQSAGRMEIRVDRWGIDAICLPSHKGLYGPQGGGMVLLGKGIHLDTFAEGGTGVNSLMGEMPEFSPERYEAGTLPTPAIAGLCKGMEFVADVGEKNVYEMEKRLFCAARDELALQKGVRIYLPDVEGGTLLFNVDEIPADEVGKRLDEMGICVRSGFHCTALGHKTLRTGKNGAVRISFGVYNDLSDVDALCAGIRQIVREG